jgi:hypothetical protein
VTGVQTCALPIYWIEPGAVLRPLSEPQVTVPPTTAPTPTPNVSDNTPHQRLLPYEIGNVYVHASGMKYTPYIHFLYAAIRDEYGLIMGDGIPLSISLEDAFKTLSVIHFSNDFRIEIEGKDASSVRYSLYNANFEPLYFIEQSFTAPAEPGTYMLCVDVKWESQDPDSQEYTGNSYIFKIVI